MEFLLPFGLTIIGMILLVLLVLELIMRIKYYEND